MATETIVLEGTGPTFNFLYRLPRLQSQGTPEYMDDCEISYSAILTDEKLAKLDEACRLGAEEFREGARTGVVRLDTWIEHVQQHLGPELLGALRIGMDVLTAPYDAGLRNLFRDNLMGSSAFLRGVLQDMDFSDYSYYQFDTRSSQVDLELSDIPIDRDPERRRLLACAFANIAKILRSCPHIDGGTAHKIGILLARFNMEGATDNLWAAANACILASIERGPKRLAAATDRMGRHDSGLEGYLLDSGRQTPTCTWDQAIVSIPSGMSRLNSMQCTLSFLFTVAVSNRMIRKPEEENARRNQDELYTPKLVCATTGLQLHQAATALLPEFCGAVKLDGHGYFQIPVLMARSELGIPAMLLPADTKCLKFLQRVYKANLPTELDPLDRRGSLLWSSVFDPNLFIEVLQAFHISPVHNYTREDEFAAASLSVNGPLFMGMHDLSRYIPGADELGLFVNEIVIQGSKGGFPW